MAIGLTIVLIYFPKDQESKNFNKNAENNMEGEVNSKLYIFY